MRDEIAKWKMDTELDPTCVLLNYKDYGRAAALARAIMKRGVHVTMIAAKGHLPPNKCYDELYECEDMYSARSVSGVMDRIAPRYRIIDVVNNAASLTCVHGILLGQCGDMRPDRTALMRAHVKAACRRVLNEDASYRVKYLLIRDESELLLVAGEVGYPAVIKPVAGQGSDNVFLAQNAKELLRRYRQLLNAPRRGVPERPYCVVKIDGRAYDLAKDVVVEEYVRGPEYTVDGYVTGGDVVVCAVHQKLYGLEEDGFRDRFYINPPVDLGGCGRAALDEYVTGAISRLGLDDTLFHVELRIRDDGVPVIIEVNPRLGGGPIADNTELMSGVSLLNVLADIVCGTYRNGVHNVLVRKDSVAYDFGITAQAAGRVKEITGLEALSKIEGIRGVDVRLKVGDVVGDVAGERFVLFCNGTAKDHDEAKRIYDELNSSIGLVMEKAQTKGGT